MTIDCAFTTLKKGVISAQPEISSKRPAPSISALVAGPWTTLNRAELLWLADLPGEQRQAVLEMYEWLLAADKPLRVGDDSPIALFYSDPARRRHRHRHPGWRK